MWKNSKKRQEEETEKCVLCGRDTGVFKSEPLEDRKNYFEGCGQLCGVCYRSLSLDE